MADVPITGSHIDTWGNALNDWLLVGHHPDGTLKGIGSAATSVWLQLDEPQELAFRVPPRPCTWVTPDGSGVVVHPTVLFFPDGWNGSQWWAAATPYTATNSDVENPCIYVSSNGLDWTPPPGVTNPLAAKPAGGFNSDVNLVISPDGELLLYYREFQADQDRLMLLRSVDGVTWSGPTTAFSTDAVTIGMLSPAVWFDPGDDAWIMLSVDNVANPRTIRRYTAQAPEGPFTFDQLVTVTPNWEATRQVWHFDARRIGDQIVMVAQTGGSGGGLEYLLVSHDNGRTFRRMTTPVVPYSGYKSAILPIVTSRGLELEMWLGTVGAGWGVIRGRLMRDRYERPMLRAGLAAKGIAPYIFGDDFERADAPSLGTSSSGGTWATTIGTLGIVSGAATAIASTNSRATTDVGVSDYDVGATVTADGIGEAYLMARYVDGSNYLRFGWDGTMMSIQRVTGGGVTVLTQQLDFPPGSHRLEIRAVGDQVTFSVDGGVMWSGTEAQGQSSTVIGVQSTNIAATINDVWCRLAM